MNSKPQAEQFYKNIKNIGFSKLPNNISGLISNNIKHSEIMLLMQLINLSQITNYMSDKTLAKNMGVNERTIQRYLTNIQNENLITINGKTSSRTISINYDLIASKLTTTLSEVNDELTTTLSEDESTTYDSSGITYDNLVGSLTTDMVETYDSSGKNNADNRSNINASPSLKNNKEYNKENKKEYIQPASQSVAPANAVAISSATADGVTASQSDGAPHLKKEKLSTINNDAILTIMYKLVEKRIIAVDGKLVPYSKDYDDELLACIPVMTEGVKINSVYDVINHLNTYIN